MSDDAMAFHAESFAGKVRLFPLPNLVMFPHVLQPLHVFEPRYRALLEEALDEDRLIAMAVLSPGWEKHYEGRPKLSDTACLGRVLTHQKVEGDRYNILLAGLRRVRIVRELPAEKMFREAEVELIEDTYPADSATDRPAAQHRLLEQFRRLLPNMPEVHQQLEELLCTDVSLGMLTDLISYTMQIPIETKVRLLQEANVDDRCEMLLKLMAQQPAAGKGKSEGAIRGLRWPPDFSAN